MSGENESLGEIAKSFERIAQAVECYKAVDGRIISSQVKPYDLEQLERDIRATPPGLKTGFEALDSIISLPQEAITIIGGRPSHGKTTLLLNLARNLLLTANNPEFVNGGKAILFFSYEQTRKQICLRWLTMASGATNGNNSHRNVDQVEQYIRGGKELNRDIDRAMQEYHNLVEKKLLWIIDLPLEVEELHNALFALKDQHPIGAVIIDYIQKVKIAGRYSTRQVELQKISERILEAAKELSLPIILGAQFGRDKERRDKVRLDNLREAGDIEQDAHLVLGLHNEAMETIQDQGEGAMERVVPLEVTVLKNRDGAVNQRVTLDFDAPILQIRDRETNELFP